MTRAQGAEYAVLGGLLLKPAKLPEVVAILTPNDFAGSGLSAIYAGILALAEQGTPPDPVTLATQKGVAPELVSDLMVSVPSAARVVHDARIVRDEAMKRRIASQAEDLAAMAKNGASAADVLTALREMEATEREQSPRLKLTAWRASAAFQHEPQPRQYLIAGGFAMGQPGLVAAAGGVGKSYMLLRLALDVANREARRNLMPPTHFCGALQTAGTAVYISGEDDQTELHNRLQALCPGPRPDALLAIPCPSAGGAPVFFKLDPKSREPVATPEWRDFCAQVEELEDLAVVIIDPLQIFCALDLNPNENAQAVCRHISALAAKTGAAVILSHHFKKARVNSLEEARDAIRGASGLVDGVRLTYALWAPDDARDMAKQLGVKYEPGGIARGGNVKGNGSYCRDVQTFLRNDVGLLANVSHLVHDSGSETIRHIIVEAVAAGAEAGRPYTRTGVNSPHERRFEFPEACVQLSRRDWWRHIDVLLEKGLLVQAMASGKSVKWLDIPTGPFARGEGIFVEGHTEKKKATCGE